MTNQFFLSLAILPAEFTVLYLAILKQCNDCVKYLISQFGAKGVGPFNESGVTASHIAASAGRLLLHQIPQSMYMSNITVHKLLTSQSIHISSIQEMSRCLN